MKATNRKIGYLSEQLAITALQQKGFQILESNFQNRFGEIDIIARDKNILVFVEVKSKTGLTFGTPEEMINARKLKKVQNMAAIYMKGQIQPCRIDVVAIVLSADNKLLRLTHYENVYR